MKFNKVVAFGILSLSLLVGSATPAFADTVNEEMIVKIDSDSVNIYKDVEFTKVLTVGKKSQEYDLVQKLPSNLVKISVDGSEAYVSLDQGASIGPKVTEEEKAAANAKAKREEAVKYALGFVGSRYTYGGASPSGFDCSGFTQYILRNSAGVSMPRNSASQSSVGTQIDASQMEPGDLVFYSRGGIDHVAMYIGDGKVVHAANERMGVTTAAWNYRAPAKIMRVIGA